MFLRQKKNKSGIISVQVIDKSSGKYKVIQTIGSSADKFKIELLISQGQEWIKKKNGLVELDFTNYQHHTEQILEGITQIYVEGTELLLGKLFDEIGFNQIPDVLFKQLVIARLSFPVSKLKTTDYLSKYHFINVDVQNIYRYLDKLHQTQIQKVQHISYNHTLRLLKTISVVFYDVTTLYFEVEKEDELRKTGFSKDGKHQHPQIVLGLLVSADGYPLAYDIFEGNKFEGHTMLPIIETFKHKYNLSKLVVVADSGLMSTSNIEQLELQGYEYIIGARIKNEKKQIQEQILSLTLKHGESAVIPKDVKSKLIISYSEKRALKDKYNRQRGLQKLDKQIQLGKLTKSNINNKGYNKYLKLEGDLKVSLDLSKLEEDSKWDGLKGYATNTDLSKNEIIENYNHLWKIEKAFRISKTDLQIRPIYHRLQRRIEAHICIAFAAYKIYKELERQLKEKQTALSAEQAIEIARTIYTIKIVHPITQKTTTKTIYISEEQKHLAKLFDL